MFERQHFLITPLQSVAQSVAFAAIVGLTGFLCMATFLAALGQMPWPALSLGWGDVPLPDAGMWVQLALTVLMLCICIFLPANARMARLERTHRAFQINMEDVKRAYALAHAADRTGVFSLSGEFEAMRQRMELLRKHPDLSQMEPELLEQIKRQAQEFALQARLDALTGLANRRAFDESLARECARARRTQLPLCLVLLDIDHFKQINDQYGHAAGDKVLRDFALLCQQSIRDTDLLGRYGGEEFILVLPEIDLQTAILSAERIRMTVAQYNFTLTSGTVLQLSCSIGIAMYLPERDDLDKLLLRADQALYQAKHQGRNRCAVQTGV